MPRELFDLTGDWEFREYPVGARRMRDLDGDDWLQARVPSSIYTCLVDAGQIDPADLNVNPEEFSHISRLAHKPATVDISKDFRLAR